MRKSYIATDKEAALLHSGQQTAIIVPMKVQPESWGLVAASAERIWVQPAPKYILAENGWFDFAGTLFMPPFVNRVVNLAEIDP